MTKPSTAPEGGRNRNKIEIVNSIEQMGTGSAGHTQPHITESSTYSNFRTTIGNRRQHLFIKPYTRYQNKSLSMA
jgi:hypothetical protein